MNVVITDNSLKAVVYKNREDAVRTAYQLNYGNDAWTLFDCYFQVERLMLSDPAMGYVLEYVVDNSCAGYFVEVRP